VAGEFVLIADDSREIRRFIEETVLIPAGYRVRSVGDGMSALALAQELNPDVVITDQQMPNLTGLQLIERLRKRSPYTPVILISSEGSELMALEAKRVGAADFLVKPFQADTLLGSLHKVLRLSVKTRPTGGDTKASPLEEDLQRRLHELETLTRIGRTVTAMLNLDDVLRTVVEEAVQLTGAEEGSLLLLDEGSGELYMRASKNFDDDFARAFRLHVRDSLAGQVMKTGDPILLDESSPQKIKTAYLVHSLIYVPLRVRGRTIGVLGVDNRKAGRVLTQQDVPVMMAMADYAAIAIENAQLYYRTESERRKLETVIKDTQSGVIVVDPENRVVMLNQTIKDAFHVKSDFFGRSAAEVFDHSQLLEIMRTGASSSRREEINVDDGRVFSVQKSSINSVGYSIVMHDITHLKDLDRIKSEFVTAVSHDLRSPLTAILGYVELIERAGPLTPQQEEFVGRVRISVEQIAHLVSDLLDLGRIEAGLDTTKERTPMAVLVHYALDSFRNRILAKGLRLETKLQEGLPFVYGDPIRLRQMMDNLLENAMKYTPAGQAIFVETEAEDDQVILRVRDTGPGIPAQDQPYLFDKFFRASNTPEDTPGTGLGLSIVKSIVDQHDGRIWVESELGQGATFTVVLPALRV
jgi:signal transduction histidine kinase/DNA-binding response OmpR family regulator